MFYRLNKRGYWKFIFLIILYLLLHPKIYSQENINEAEILIFSLSEERVIEQKGVLKIQISTFSPIQLISVGGKSQQFPSGASLVWLKIPYELDPGINNFEVYVKSKFGEAKKLIQLIYETPEFLNNAKLGDPFQLITILGTARSDNIEKVDEADNKSNAISSNILFVPSYRYDINNISSIFLRGVIMGDQYHDGMYESKEVLFKQVCIEWEGRDSWAGDLTLSLSKNEAGTREIPITSSPFFNNLLTISDPIKPAAPVTKNDFLFLNIETTK